MLCIARLPQIKTENCGSDAFPVDLIYSHFREADVVANVVFFQHQLNLNINSCGYYSGLCG